MLNIGEENNSGKDKIIVRDRKIGPSLVKYFEGFFNRNDDY